MAVLVPKKEFEVCDFRMFCNTFNINSKKCAGDDGTDEELLIEELNKIKDDKWLINFIDNRNNGYFRLQLIE
jgi:hypothetical protein